MEPLLTAIVLWLSANFNLPATFNYPRVEFVPSNQMATLRYKGLLSARTREAMALAEQPIHAEQVRQVVAVYNDHDKTIYLPNGWTGRTPAELSMLVHEMVHHLQNAAGLKYECPQAREKLAYEAQSKWLDLFGLNLENELDIDPLALIVSTQCLIWPP
jgi:hypothetical protein